MSDYSATQSGLRHDLEEPTTYSHFAVQLYFGLLCVTTLVRAVEAGILASMMPDIKENLQFTYTIEGTIAASPDMGLIPSGLIAMFIFSYFRAKYVMNISLLCIPTVMLISTSSPTSAKLCITRAAAGLAWGFACVHYPMWIHRFGFEDSRTMWFGLYNCCLVGGLLVGFVGGVVCSETGVASWTWLYATDAWILLGCAIGATLFPQQVLQVVQGVRPLWGDNEGSFDENIACCAKHLEAAPMVGHAKSTTPWCLAILPEKLVSLLTSKLFMLLMCFSGSIAGNAAFLLYFIMQQMDALGYQGPSQYTALFVVFALGPVPGNIFGAYILTRLGGYTDYPVAFNMFTFCCLTALIAAGFMTLFACLEWHIMYAIAIWVFTFAGSMPSAGVNGIAVSLGTGGSQYASGMQFFVQNAAKLVFPQLGGIVVQFLGVRLGVCIVFNCTSVLAIIVTYLGYCEAKLLQGDLAQKVAPP